MKAVLLDGYGDSGVLRIGEAPRPTLKSGQVLIRVIATSVNRADIVQRQGNYPPPPDDSEILGLEAAGIIEEIGPEVTGWQPGDRVMSLVAGGGYAEFAVAYAGHLMPIPASLTFAEAAAVSEVYLTAFSNIFLVGRLEDGQSILVHGATGGVGIAAVQLCRALAPRSPVIVTASTGKLDRVESMGVDLAVDYKKENFTDRILSYTHKKGVDMILDHIGAAYLDSNLKGLAVSGTLVIIGLVGGRKAELDIGRLMVKRQRIIGSVLRARPVEEKTKLVSQFVERVLPLIAERKIVPVIHDVFALEDAAEAHQVMEESRHFGKIVLKVADTDA